MRGSLGTVSKVLPAVRMERCAVVLPDAEVAWWYKIVTDSTVAVSNCPRLRRVAAEVKQVRRACNTAWLHVSTYAECGVL